MGTGICINMKNIKVKLKKNQLNKMGFIPWANPRASHSSPSDRSIYTSFSQPCRSAQRA